MKIIILTASILLAVPTLSLGITASDLEKAKQAVKQEYREAEQELNEIRSDPKRFRGFVSVTQAALGALGYGTGPFHGNLDQKIISAIRHYQVTRN